MDQDVPFERIGGYRILRRLATGGTSDVLLARAEGPHGFERTVVLKLLLQQFRRDAPMEKMFAREAAAYARLSHPAIVKLYDFFSAEGQLVMVLEFIDGLPLNRFRAMLRKNGEQVDDRASIFIASRVFAALAAAHAARDPESGEFAPVIHRDVNPSNILIPWDGHVKLADFGIAKVAGVSSDTQAGFIKGTYGYMAPEQVRGEPITIRTDVYAASLLLWELLARRKAIQRGALPEIEVLRAMAEPSLPSLDVLRPDLPARLREAIAKGLEPLPDARSVTAEEMLIVLRESVTSNEGRNVLADTLARVRQDAEASRSGNPPAVSADTTAKVPAQPAAPPRPAAPSRTASEISIDGRMRTALGTGQVAAVSTVAPVGNAILARVTPIPPSMRNSSKPPAAPPVRSVATMAMGLLREEPLGTYSAVAAPGRPVSEERPVPIAPPAPSPNDSGSLPPVLLGTPIKTISGSPSPIVMIDSIPPVLGGAVPAPQIPPPPPAMLAVVEQYEARPSTAPASFAPPPAPPHPAAAPPPPAPLGPPPPLFTPMPDQARPASMPPSQPIAAMLASSLPQSAGAAMPLPLATPSYAPVPDRPRLPLPSAPEIRKSNATTYALLAIFALLASGAVVVALLLTRPSSVAPPPASTIAAKVTATPTPTAIPTPPPTPSAIATPTPTPSAIATPTPPLPTPPSTPTSSTDGDIVTPPHAAGHRVFVDGRYAGDSPGPIRVHCGPHTVKVGSNGTPHAVAVPCGGSVTVAPR